MSIRPLTPDDAEAFWALRLRAVREEPTCFGRSYEEESRRAPSHARDVLRGDTEDDFVLGAFLDGTLVGIAGLKREQPFKRRHRATLWGMYVAPEARGRGLARGLVNAVLERASRLEGLERIRLTVVADNAPARALYEAVGFRVFGCEPGAMKLEGRDYDELSMGLTLGRERG